MDGLCRSLLHKLLTTITNGDRIVLNKLDSCITTVGDDTDDENFALSVDHGLLVDEDPTNMVLTKDLLYLPKKLTRKVLCHPVITTFIEKRWTQTRWTFLIMFSLYLTFVLLFSSFLWLMYERYEEHDLVRIPVELPKSCDPLQPIGLAQSGETGEVKPRMLELDLIDITNPVISTRGRTSKNKAEDDFELKLEVVKKRKNKTSKSRVRKKFVLFSGCSANKKLRDIDLCVVEFLLLLSILVLLIQEFWQSVALGRNYFRELENWFELLILALAGSTLALKTQLDSLQIVSAIGICLAWIELIFLFGRYPFLGRFITVFFTYDILCKVVALASCTTPSRRGLSKLL